VNEVELVLSAHRSALVDHQSHAALLDLKAQVRLVGRLQKHSVDRGRDRARVGVGEKVSTPLDRSIIARMNPYARSGIGDCAAGASGAACAG
jgi:hypothetical protein